MGVLARSPRMIARNGPWGGYYFPPAPAQDDEEFEEIEAPANLDLGFLDEDDEIRQLPPGLDLGFLDDPIPGPPALQQVVPAVQAPPPAVVPPAPAVVPPAPAVVPPPVAVVPPAPAVVPPAPAVVPPPAAPAPAPSRMGELTALAGEAQIRALTLKVEELLAANLIDVDVSAPYRLGGKGPRTAEVRFTVRPRGRNGWVVKFVAHYHPDAEKASVGQAAASQRHIKKWTNANKAYNYPDLKHETHPLLNKLVPKAGTVNSRFDQLPTGKGLYKPK
jgi:hypothetical protein